MKIFPITMTLLKENVVNYFNQSSQIANALTTLLNLWVYESPDFEELMGVTNRGMSMLRISVSRSQFSCRLILMIMKCKYIHL